MLGSVPPQRAFTVGGVCREAGLEPRDFHESFDSLEELVKAIYDDEVVELMTVTLAAVDRDKPDDARALASTVLRTVLRRIGEDPRRGRLLVSPAIVVPLVEERREAATRLFVNLLKDMVRDQLAVPEGDVLEVAAEILVGGLMQATSRWLDDEIGMEQEDFIEACIVHFAAVVHSLASR